MHWTKISSIVLGSMACTIGCGIAYAIDPPSMFRVPNDAILQEPTEHVDESDPLPVRISFRSKPIPKYAQPHYVVLGTRDDSLASEYQLDGVRGRETPAGPRTGRYCQPGMERAGHPWFISKRARTALGSDYKVGYVGGGTPFSFGGECRKSNEGTFGLDYSGLFFSRKTWLYWTHGSRYQGGAGRYETEGPRILPEKE